MPGWMKRWNGLRSYKIYKVSKKKKKMMLDDVGWMKFVPEQNFIQHVSMQMYEFFILDRFGGVFHPTFINFRWFRTFALLNCNLDFLICFRILNFVSITNIYCGWGRHKTIYYSCITRPCIINKVFNNIDIANLQLLYSWNRLWSCLYFSRNRWIVPTSWNLKRIEWIRGNIITPFPF